MKGKICIELGESVTLPGGDSVVCRIRTAKDGQTCKNCAFYDCQDLCDAMLCESDEREDEAEVMFAYHPVMRATK